MQSSLCVCVGGGGGYVTAATGREMQFNSPLYDNNLHKNCTAPPEEGADMQLSCYLYSGHAVAFQYSDYNYKTLTGMALRIFYLFKPLLL